MISTGQYPTVINWSTQNFEATELITALNIDDPELTDAYWLGWVAYDNLPDAFKISRQVIDEDARTMSFVDVTRPENVDIAIISPAFMSSTPNMNNPYTAIYSGEIWRRFDGINSPNFKIPSDNSRFINKFDVNTLEMNNTYIVINIIIDDATDAHTIITMLPPELYDRHFTRTITTSDIIGVSGPPVPNNISFDISDSMLDGTLQTVTASDHTIKFFAGSFGVSGFGRPLVVGGASRGNYYHPLPVVRLHDSDDHTFLIGGSRFFAMSTGWSGGGYRITPSTGAINGYDFYDIATRSIVGGFAGSVSLDDVAALAGNYDIIEATNGNFIVQGVGRGQYAMVRRKYTWDEIITTLSYMMRYCTELSYTTDANKYYPAISEKNEFLGYLLNGATDRDELRPWQIAGTALNADTNEYTPADKPPYIPAEGDEDEKIGDSIGFNVNIPGGNAAGLYTMYALRQAHINNLGAALWSAINSPDGNFWQNLQMALGAYTETGSADISSVLEFIDAIRLYPFALVNLPGFVGAGTGAIKIGSGKTSIDLSSGGVGNVGIMGRYTGIIDAGSVTVPAHYGDFRDYDGVSVSVYLPYIGNITIDAAEVTGQTLQATYAVDLTSGSCVAYLLLSGRWGYYPIGIYNGTIGADIPLTAAQGNRLFTRQLSGIVGKISGITAGRAVPESVGAAMSAVSRLQSAANALTASALTPPALSGGNANFAGFGAPQTAYVQIRRHLYAYTARNFPAAEMGRRTYGVKVLGTLSGFTVCDAVDVSGIPAPADIQTDIKKALESGVYL